jgi:hypothetical protein
MFPFCNAGSGAVGMAFETGIGDLSCPSTNVSGLPSSGFKSAMRGLAADGLI